MSEPERLLAPVPYVVHGSFRKYMDVIAAAIGILDSTGLAVALAPQNCDVAGQQSGFALLGGEAGKDPLDLEEAYKKKVKSLRALGGFSLFVNPEGYIGKSAAYEWGVAEENGVRCFFTHKPEDIPVHANPSDILSVNELGAKLRRHNGLPPFQPDTSVIGQRWENQPTPTALVAVGGVVRYRDQILLTKDGRWQDRLTVPGTTVRKYESHDQALTRLAAQKFGLQIEEAVPFRASFMLDARQDKAFDDQVITLGSRQVDPQSGLAMYWLSINEIQGMVHTEQIEPNASALLEQYLALHV